MAVAYTYNSVKRENYEKVFPKALGSTAAPQGLILHAAGEEPDGTWHIIEVWNSDDERSRWERETLMPALDGAGIDTTQGPPEWTRVEVVHLVAAPERSPLPA